MRLLFNVSPSFPRHSQRQRLIQHRNSKNSSASGPSFRTNFQHQPVQPPLPLNTTTTAAAAATATIIAGTAYGNEFAVVNRALPCFTSPCHALFPRVFPQSVQRTLLAFTNGPSGVIFATLSSGESLSFVGTVLDKEVNVSNCHPAAVSFAA